MTLFDVIAALQIFARHGVNAKQLILLSFS